MSPTDASLHHLIRREVFVSEQGVFADDDLDDLDGFASTIKVIATLGDRPAGTVRLYPVRGFTWQGDRLAVRTMFRRSDVGGRLVRFAVMAAASRGGRRMTAHVQLPNVEFFEALGWRRSAPVELYVGLPHQPMDIDLLSDPAAR